MKQQILCMYACMNGTFKKLPIDIQVEQMYHVTLKPYLPCVVYCCRDKYIY